MTLSPLIRRSLLAIVVPLLLWLAWNGISGGISQVSQSTTSGQLVQTVTQFAFGFFALFSVVTTFWWTRWNTFMLAGWTASVTLAAGLAAVAWGGASILIGLLTGGAALLVAMGISWLLRAGARGLTHA